MAHKKDLPTKPPYPGETGASHIKGEAGGLLQARGEESPEVRNVYDIARRGGDQGNGGSARGVAGEGDGAAGGGDRLGADTDY